MLMSQVHLLEHMTQVTLQIGLFLQTQMVQEKHKMSFLAAPYTMLPAMEFLTHQSGLCTAVSCGYGLFLCFSTGHCWGTIN